VRGAVRSRSIEDHDDVATLWRVFKKTGSAETRERLILHYTPLVRFVASRVGAGVPGSVEHADLVSYGTIGLIEAVDRFDPARNIKFETYAVTRIRGAMLDEMRALDWVPRSVRARFRRLETAKSKLRADLLREPTHRELADELGCETRDLRRAAAVSLVTLEEMVALGGGEDGDHVTVLDTIEDDTAADPGARVEFEETRRALVEALAALEEREQTMISQYYFAERTLAHIGRAFGVTESRVSQIHSKALRSLRTSEGVRDCAEAYGWTTDVQDAFDARIASLPARRIA
jgi:RNA polymerase sigma factor for flagellar operon FliA